MEATGLFKGDAKKLDQQIDRRMEDGQVTLRLTINQDPEGSRKVDETMIVIDPSSNERGIEVQGEFHGADVREDQTYYLSASVLDKGSVMAFQNVISNEDWDEGLPVPFDGYDPYGQFYQGISMNVRWMDDENKREMYKQNLAQVDYIIVPSQRAVWSVCRLPLMYPMTIEYYRSLFHGELGFDQIASFQSPLKVGPLWVSDIGGTAAWNAYPKLPLFNFNLLAAEEAFSVYDHPPVWIFKKEENFSMELVNHIFDAVNLSDVIIQTPKNTKVIPIH